MVLKANVEGLFNIPLGYCKHCFVVVAMSELIKIMHELIEKGETVDIKCPVCDNNLIYDEHTEQ